MDFVSNQVARIRTGVVVTLAVVSERSRALRAFRVLCQVVAVAALYFFVGMAAHAQTVTFPDGATCVQTITTAIVPYLLVGFGAMATLSVIFWIVGLMVRRRRV